MGIDELMRSACKITETSCLCISGLVIREASRFLSSNRNSRMDGRGEERKRDRDGHYFRVRIVNFPFLGITGIAII
jgi:hypothetical protein